MLFKNSSSIHSKLSPQQLKEKLKGAHFQIHNLDFEVMEKEGILKIIPHTELADEKIYTLPITHLLLEEEKEGTKIRMKSKPRRIDIGGPNLVLLFTAFIIMAGVGMYTLADASYKTASYIIMGIGLIIGLFFVYRMQMGYFDYIRKQKNWIKNQF